MSQKGFLAIPRGLLKDPIWKSFDLVERHIFLTIYENCAWQEMDLNDHGLIVHLLPLQIMFTYRGLEELCDHPLANRSKIERFLLKLISLGFSRQEVRRKKTILTITQKDILEMHETNFETKSRQSRDINKQENNFPKEQQQQSVVVVSCHLPKDCGLSEADQFSLLSHGFSQDRLDLAIAFIGHPKFKPKTSHLAAAIWHCQQAVPPVHSIPVYSPEQKLAYDFVDELAAMGEPHWKESNKDLIPSGYVMIPSITGPGATKVSLKNDLRTIQGDLDEVRKFYFKKKGVN